MSAPGAEPAGRPASVEVRFLGHATVLLELPAVRILTDPFLRERLGPLRRHGPVPNPDAIGPVDVVLISHAHPDHFDRRSLAMVAGDPLVIVPRGLEALVERAGHRARGTVVGESIAIGGGRTVRPVRARHWRWPGAPRATAIGYLIERPGDDRESGPGIYFAGDTAPYPEMVEFADQVDLALLPVGSWGPHRSPGHLTPRSAARVARDLAAQVAVPIHWGTLYLPKLERVAGGRLMGPATRFVASAAELAPALEVRLLQPGEATTIEV